jgi:hypothetical protein
MRQYFCIVALLIGAPVSHVNACEAIPGLIAKLRPNPVEVYRTRELLPISLRTVSEKATLIVEGYVQPLKTYMSADRCYLMTDFAVTVRSSIAGPSILQTKPGPPFVFTQFGGEDIIDGVRVKVEDTQLPLLKAGQHVILFLSQFEQGGKYEMAGISGAFEVVDDHVTPLVKVPIEDIADMVTDRVAFINRVKAFHAGK